MDAPEPAERPPRAPALLAPIAAAVALAAVVRNGFVDLDDPHLLLAHDRWHGFTDGRLEWMLETVRGGIAQPLAWISLGFDGLLTGGGPASAGLLHGVALALHAATAFLLARLVTALLRHVDVGRAAAWAGALAATAWAVHPLRVEAVAWASARGDVLGSFLAVGSALALVRAVGGPELRPRAVLLSGALATLAVLAQPLLLGLPVALATLAVWLRRTRPDSVAGWASPSALGGTLLVFMVPAALGLLMVVADGVIGSPGRPAGALALAHAGGVLRALRATLLPTGLHPAYDPPPGFPDDGVASLALDAGLLAVLAVVTAAGLRRATPTALVGAAFLGLLIPAVALGQAPSGADRFAGLATIGLFVGAAAGVLRWAATPGRRRLAAAAALLLCATLGAFAARQTTFWKDGETLEGRTLELDPANERALATRAARVRKAGESWATAARLHRRSLEHGEPRPYAHAGLGAALLEVGDVAAERHLVRATELAPWLPAPHQALGALRLRLGDWAAARASLREAARLDARSSAAWFALGRAAALDDDVPAAVTAFERAVELAPDDPLIAEALERAKSQLD